MTPIESLFHIHSFGYAAENKDIESFDLEVWPVETLSYIDGELTSFKDILKSEGEDAFGNKYAVEVKSSNTIKATWIPFGSNRRTPPDVRRGERLLIWRYGDVDRYYWSTCGLDDVLRRLETVVYAWSNTRDESVKILDETNTYYFQISTHLKLVTFSTSKSDGEPYVYTIQINTKKGYLIVTDDIGNRIEMDSGEKIIEVENADGTKYVLDKHTITSYAKESSTHVTDGAYIVKCNTYNMKADDSATSTSPNINMNATEKYSVVSPMISENGA